VVVGKAGYLPREPREERYGGGQSRRAPYLNVTRVRTAKKKEKKGKGQEGKRDNFIWTRLREGRPAIVQALRKGGKGKRGAETLKRQQGKGTRKGGGTIPSFPA